MNWLASMIPCTASIVTPLIALLCITLLVQLSFISKYHSKPYWLIMSCQVVLLFMIAWLGSYRFSPLYTNVKTLDRRFNIIVDDREEVNIRSGEIVTLGQTSTAVIVPLTLPGDTVSCNWSSQMGGALDDPNSCETIYAPPAADYDILRLSVRSSCGLSNDVGQIKISILP
jgi:hypothetical protein